MFRFAFFVWIARFFGGCLSRLAEIIYLLAFGVSLIASFTFAEYTGEPIYWLPILMFCGFVIWKSRK